MNNFTFRVDRASKLLLCYLVVIYTLIFITIQVYLKIIVIKFIVLTISYLSLINNITKYISKTATNSILQLHYNHPKKWEAVYSSGEIANIVISDFFISQLVIILTINNITAKTKHKEIIAKDQISEDQFNKLHTVINLIKIHKARI